MSRRICRFSLSLVCSVASGTSASSGSFLKRRLHDQVDLLSATSRAWRVLMVLQDRPQQAVDLAALHRQQDLVAPG